MAAPPSSRTGVGALRTKDPTDDPTELHVLFSLLMASNGTCTCERGGDQRARPRELGRGRGREVEASPPAAKCKEGGGSAHLVVLTA
jgi:hypothetical protein